MEISTDIWIFVGLIGVGAVMQSTSGFALGLVAITGMSILDLRSIPFTTAVVGPYIAGQLHDVALANPPFD